LNRFEQRISKSAVHNNGLFGIPEKAVEVSLSNTGTNFSLHFWHYFSEKLRLLYLSP